MSFERWSTSDIYMFEHVGGFIECCGCWFSGDWLNEHVEFPRFKTPYEALAHLDVHENAGHDIGNARNRIIQTYNDLSVCIEPYVLTEGQKARHEELRKKMKAAFEESKTTKEK